MITLLSLLGSVYATCVTNNINLNTLGIVGNENYRLPLSTYFSGDGLTYSIPTGTQFQTIQTLVTKGIKVNSNLSYQLAINVVATAVQNANGDPNVQTNNYAALYSTGTATSPSYAVAFGVMVNGQISYDQQTGTISTTLAGTFGCSSLAFYAPGSVIVSCTIASATSIQQYFYYLQVTSLQTVPAPLIGKAFNQAIDNIQTRIQIAYYQSVPNLCLLGYNGGTNGAQSTGTSIFNCYTLTISAANVPSIPAAPSIILTSVSSYFIDFYVSSNGYIFLLQYQGGLNIYAQGQTTVTTTINPLGTQNYIALGVHEVQLSENVYDFLIAVSSATGIAMTAYNPLFPNNNFIVNSFIATDVSSTRGGRLYINYDYVVVNNGLLLSVFPGPANRINENKSGSLLLGQVTLLAPSQTTFSNLQNLVTIANSQQQGVYSINNPLLITSSYTGTSTLTVTATDTSTNTCQVTFNFQSVTTQQIVSTQNTATTQAQLTSYYPLQTTINYSSWFQGPALSQPNLQLDNTQVEQITSNNPVPTKYILSQIFPNPLNYEETSIQVSTDGTAIYFVEVNALGDVISNTNWQVTPAVPIQKISQFSVGVFQKQIFWGYIDSGANTIYLYLESTQVETIPPIPEDNTANPTYYIFNQIQIVGSNTFVVAQTLLFYATYSTDIAAEPIATILPSNGQMWFNTVAFGDIFFVSYGTTLQAYKVFQGELNTVGTPITTTNSITSVGVTGYGIYILTSLGQTQSLLFYPKSYLFAYQNSQKPITVSTQGYTLSKFAASTYDHFYIYGFNGQQSGILVFQESAGLLNSLYFIYEPANIDELTYFSVVGWYNFDAILVGYPLAVGSQPIYSQLFPYITVTFSSQNTAALQSSQQTTIPANSVIGGFTTVTVPLNITTYNYVDYISVVPSSVNSQQTLNSNGLFSFDPRIFFNGNIANIVSTVDTQNLDATYSNVLNSSGYQTINSAVVSSAVVTQIIGGSPQQSILLQVTNGTIFNISTYNTKSKIYSNYTPSIAGVAQFKAGCVLTFVDFFTQQPITICQDETTIYFNQYVSINNHSLQTTAQYTPTANYLLQSAEYIGGVLMLVLNNGQDTIAQFGIFVATTIQNTQGIYGQFVELRSNPLDNWSLNTPVILLNLGIAGNILNTILNCQTNCVIQYGSLMTLADGTTTGYIYQSTLNQATLQGIYLSGAAIPLSGAATLISIPTTIPVEFTVTLPNIIGVTDTYYALAQLGNYTNLGSVGSIVPVIFVSGSLSYWIDLYFYQDLYWKGSLECTLLGYESTDGTVPVSVAAINGTVALGFPGWVASYGNISNICKSNQVATIIGAYQYPATNVFSPSNLLQIIPTQPQPYILTPYDSILTCLPEYYLALLPNKTSSSPYILSSGTSIPVQLTATSLNSISTISTIVPFKSTSISLGTPENDSTHWIWALYISLGLIVVLGTLGYLCYQSHKPKTDYYAEV